MASQQTTVNSIVEPSQDPTSPFYIHPSDNPGMKLVSEKFDGNAYSDWKRSMLISLSAKNKLGFVDGSINKPDATDNTFKAWQRCNSMLISWLLGVLDQNLARSVLYFDTAREIWQNLEERFGTTSGTTLYALEQSLNDIKQGAYDVSNFFTKIKWLWDEYDALDPLPVCTCNNCACTITQKLLKSQQDRRLIQFLMKLNGEFEVVRGNLLLMQPLPAISHAYRLLVQEEKHKQLYRSNPAPKESMAFAVNKRRFPDSFNDKNRQHYQRLNSFLGEQNRKINYYCDHCKMLGHSIQRCFKLNGYPPRSNPTYRIDKRVAANVQYDDDAEQQPDQSAPITQSQFQQLVEMISKQQNNNPQDDSTSSKSAHVAGKFSLLLHQDQLGLLTVVLQTIFVIIPLCLMICMLSMVMTITLLFLMANVFL